MSLSEFEAPSTFTTDISMLVLGEIDISAPDIAFPSELTLLTVIFDSLTFVFVILITASIPFLTTAKLSLVTEYVFASIVNAEPLATAFPALSSSNT